MPLRETDEGGHAEVDSVFDLINDPNFVELTEGDKKELRRQIETSKNKFGGFKGGFDGTFSRTESNEVLSEIQDIDVVSLEQKIRAIEDGDVDADDVDAAMEEVWFSLQLLERKRNDSGALAWLQCRYHELK